MVFRFDTHHEFPGWDKASTLILRLIEQHHCKRILEVGGGANPCLSLDAIAAYDLDYTTNDVSPVELAKADDRYKTLCLDVGGALPPAAPRESFDLIFSRMVNEHVADGARYYRNIYQLLSRGGYTFHCFSTPFTLPFVVNRVLPERLSSLLLDAVAPRDDPEHHGKFHAYYNWCVGPSVRMVQRLSDIGFDVLEYNGYFGHEYYAAYPALQRLEEAKATWLSQHPTHLLTSYASLLLRRPLCERTSIDALDTMGMS